MPSPMNSLPQHRSTGCVLSLVVALFWSTACGSDSGTAGTGNGATSAGAGSTTGANTSSTSSTTGSATPDSVSAGGGSTDSTNGSGGATNAATTAPGANASGSSTNTTGFGGVNGNTTGGGAPSGDASTGATSSTGGATSTGGTTGNPPVTWPLINGVQWADTDGDPIQAHGGGLLQVGEDYYWFGENRNPDGTFYAVSAYRSRDLRRWEYVNDVLTMNSHPELSPANIERPKVVYNASTGKYVMWMHWENGMDYSAARAAVASSDTVDGSYTYHGSFRPYQDSGVVDHDRPGYMSRDCTLFVDDDGKGYFLSSTNENYDLNLYLLTDDYLDVDTLAARLFEGGHREAPALFKRGNTYFLLTSGATGWDPNQAKYATSTSLTSGWSSMQNVGDGNTFYSQSTYVLPVAGSQGTEYLYLGDRWAGAWGGRVNDSTYVWQPISFPSTTSMSMSWFNNVHIDVALGTVSGTVDAFEFINKKSGMLLSVEGPANQNSADLIQNPEGTATSAVWRLNYDAAGYFRLTNDDGGKVIDVPDESTASGVDLGLWDDNGGDHQAWRLIDQGQGLYRVQNKKSGLYLGVAGGSTEAAASVQQQSSGGDEQLWEITASNAGP